MPVFIYRAGDGGYETCLIGEDVSVGSEYLTLSEMVEFGCSDKVISEFYPNFNDLVDIEEYIFDNGDEEVNPNGVFLTVGQTIYSN